MFDSCFNDCEHEEICVTLIAIMDKEFVIKTPNGLHCLKRNSIKWK